MVRRTITLPDHLEMRVRDVAAEHESFSAAVARLIERGLADTAGRPAWIGSMKSGEGDLSMRVEEILDQLYRTADPND